MRFTRIEDLWASERAKLEAIHSSGGFQEWFNLFCLPNLGEFTVRNVLCCGDDRVPFGRISLPGLILELGLPIKENVTTMVALVTEYRIGAVHWHAGCGGAESYLSRLLGEEAANHSVDAFAMEIAKRIATEADIGLFQDRLEPDEDFHPSCVIFNTTLPLDLSRVMGVPSAFDLTWLFGWEEQCQSHLELLTKLALSEHGFGDRFSPNTPLYWITVGGSDEKGDAMRACVKGVHLRHAFPGLIRRVNIFV